MWSFAIKSEHVSVTEMEYFGVCKQNKIVQEQYFNSESHWNRFNWLWGFYKNHWKQLKPNNFTFIHLFSSHKLHSPYTLFGCLCWNKHKVYFQDFYSNKAGLQCKHLQTNRVYPHGFYEAFPKPVWLISPSLFVEVWAFNAQTWRLRHLVPNQPVLAAECPEQVFRDHPQLSRSFVAPVPTCANQVCVKLRMCCVCTVFARKVLSQPVRKGQTEMISVNLSIIC